MSYQNDSGLGKRSQPKGGYNNFSNNDGNQNNFARRRDQKQGFKGQNQSFSKDNTESLTNLGGVSACTTPGDGAFSNYPEIPSKSVEVMKSKGYMNLFPIQQHCFYPVYNREDLIARDLTGSGKTVAFGLPTIEYLRKNNLLGTGKVQAIMLAPTRELAVQITAELSKLKHHENEFRIVTVYGGVSVMDQTQQLKRGVDLFVGTTGRVKDHIERGNIDFSGLKTLILDEADVMLKLGFKEDVDQILAKARETCQKDLQILLFSATVPAWVRDIAREHMKPNFRVVDLAQDLTNRTAKNIQHLAIECRWHERLDALSKVLNCYGGTGRILVFTSTKADANATLLSDQITHDVEVMHGDIAQNQREVTLKRFKDMKFQVLVATDVAARGLDIPSIELVIQMEPPKDTESYIHRSGRTARAGKSGVCITFFNPRNQEFLDKVEQMAGIKMTRVPIPSQQDMLKAKTKDVLTKFKDVEEDVLPNFKETAQLLIKQHNGDYEKALCVTLAYTSGHYKQSNPTKSLLTGRDNMVTIKMCVDQGRELPESAAKAIISKYWAPRIAEQIRDTKTLSDGSGICFDVSTRDADGFIENYEHLKQSQDSRRVDFLVSRCKTLPPCSGGSGGGGGGYNGQGGYGGNSRGGGGYGDRRGGNSYGGGGNSYGGGNSGGASGGWDSKPAGGSNSYRDEREQDGGNQGGSGGWTGGGQWNKENQPTRFNVFENAEQQKPERSYSMLYASTQEESASYSQISSRPQTPNRSSQEGGHTIYITNLNFKTSEQNIMNFLKGENYTPLRAKLLYNQDGLSRGTGFVQMSSSQEAAQVIDKMNNISFEGRNLQFNMATNQSH